MEPNLVRYIPSTESLATKRTAKRCRNSAFTIVEVMMAAGVMALAITSALIAMGRAFGPLDSARCISYASQIMQSEMEKIRLTSWGNGTTAGTGTTGVSAYPVAATAVTIDSTFTTANDIGSRMTMTRSMADVHTGMLKITLTITWKNAEGRTMTRSYFTYYGKAGLYDFFAA